MRFIGIEHPFAESLQRKILPGDGEPIVVQFNKRGRF